MKLSQEELQRAADKAEANFKLLWSFFSEDGRGMTLAGMDEVSENVISIVRNSFVVGTSPLYDIEFPLIGKPQMDISVGYFSNELPDDINLVGNDIFLMWINVIKIFLLSNQMNMCRINHQCPFTFRMTFLANIEYFIAIIKFFFN